MDEVGSPIFPNPDSVFGANGEKISTFGAKKITFSRCEYTTKTDTKKYFVYFILNMCISSMFHLKKAASALFNI